MLALCALAACADAPTSPTRPLPVAPLLSSSGPAPLVDIAYASRSSAQKLDIHLPTAGAKPYPVVVWVHGGGWSSGDKNLGLNAPPRQLLNHGYAVVSVNYRLSGEARFPAQIQDLKAAVRWIRANASRYGLNATRIGAWGVSAGAHLAGLLGTASGVASLTDLSLGNGTMSDAVQSVVSWSGADYFLSLDSQLKLNGCPLYAGLGHNAATSPPSLLMGAPIQTIPSKVQAASPRYHVSAGDAKFLFQHGMADCTIPYQQSRIFANRLKTVLGSAHAQIDLFPAGKHGGTVFTSTTNVTRVINYIKATI